MEYTRRDEGEIGTIVMCGMYFGAALLTGVLLVAQEIRDRTTRTTSKPAIERVERYYYMMPPR